MLLTLARRAGLEFQMTDTRQNFHNHQNLKSFEYSKPDFDGFSKILVVFDG